jgi:hypothetical protein
MRTCATHLVSSPILYHCQVWKIVLGIWGLRFLFVFGFVVKQVWVLSLAAKSLTWRSPKQAQLQRWFNMVPSHPPPPVVMITGCTRKSRVEHHKHLCQSSQLVQVRPRGGRSGGAMAWGFQHSDSPLWPVWGPWAQSVQDMAARWSQDIGFAPFSGSQQQVLLVCVSRYSSTTVGRSLENLETK